MFVNFEICHFSLLNVLIGIGGGDYVGSFRCAYGDQLSLLDMLIWVECVFFNFEGRCMCVFIRVSLCACLSILIL